MTTHSSGLLRLLDRSLVGVGKESVRRWVRQTEVDSGQRPGMTTEELEEIKKLDAENRRLREDVAILRAATSFFASMPS